MKKAVCECFKGYEIKFLCKRNTNEMSPAWIWTLAQDTINYCPTCGKPYKKDCGLTEK